VHWHNVANSERSFGSGVDKLSCIHAFDGDEVLSVLLVSVLVSEGDLGEGCTSAWVVHDVLDNTLDVTVSLWIVQGSEASRCDSLRGVSFENRASASSLSSDDSSHD